MKALFVPTIKDGKLDFGSDYNAARFRQYLKDNDGELLEIYKHENTRSLSQNSLYWKYLGEIEAHTGNWADDLHQYFKRKFIPPKFITVLGKEIKIPGSTTELTKTDFSEYIRNISIESGVAIPDTEDYKRWQDSAPLANETYIHAKT